jgi:hypothetical protein
MAIELVVMFRLFFTLGLREGRFLKEAISFEAILMRPLTGLSPDITTGLSSLTRRVFL